MIASLIKCPNCDATELINIAGQFGHGKCCRNLKTIGDLTMPGRDKTGPQGQGSMTGRQAGDCTENKDDVEPKAVELKTIEPKAAFDLKVKIAPSKAKIPGQRQFQGPKGGYGFGRGGGPGNAPGAGKGFGRGARRSSGI